MSLPDVLREWVDGDVRRPVLVCPLPSGSRAISTAVLGGGIGPCGWWLNAQVSMTYDHPDPVAHTAALAASFDLAGPGVAMLTAAEVGRYTTADDGGVTVVATVGLGLPVPAAAHPERAASEHQLAGTAGSPHPAHLMPLAHPRQPAHPRHPRHPRPGTINLFVVVPVALGDAALVNAVTTATEAKTQALVEAGVPGTGTSSDAICIACPEVTDAAGAGDTVEAYGGPRSTWGARIARAVHAAVATGTADWTAAHPAGDPHRSWGPTWP